MDDEAQFAARLRAALVDRLRDQGAIRDDRVAEAFATVPRHVFVPGESLETAYADEVVVTKRDRRGIVVSSVSAPQIQAVMLEQARLAPGMRALEIGSGGYNAALMAELVGEEGEVTSVDIDPEVIDRARRCLAEAGYARVRAVLADAEDGVPEHAPYDRVIVTVAAWDIPPAWVDQLAEDGSITVPLRMCGLTRSIAFARDGGRLVGESVEPCGFVAMQGSGAHAERLLFLRDREVVLLFDEGLPDEPESLDGVLDLPRAEAWSGVMVGGVEPFDTLHLWLATALPGFCLLAVDPLLDSGVVSPANRQACAAVVDVGAFAYLTVRRVSGRGRSRYEFGVYAHGRDADGLADRMAEQIGHWDRRHRSGPGPRITAYPAGTPDERLPGGQVVDKRHTRLVITWP
ncbi:methyltransferase, FxLD system [Nonomuraea sp. NPDC046570]|uniref:methyltransferase, FxLD system n=1 Tax=Nonomuraea sp. NPDC046570 TaxID=3155255 RepID=UPI0033C269A2